MRVAAAVERHIQIDPMTMEPVEKYVVGRNEWDMAGGAPLKGARAFGARSHHCLIGVLACRCSVSSAVMYSDELMIVGHCMQPAILSAWQQTDSHHSVVKQPVTTRSDMSAFTDVSINQSKRKTRCMVGTNA